MSDSSKEDLAALHHPVGHWDWEPDQRAPYGAPEVKIGVLYRCLAEAMPQCQIEIRWMPGRSGDVLYEIGAKLTLQHGTTKSALYRLMDEELCRFDRPIWRIAQVLARVLSQTLVKDIGL